MQVKKLFVEETIHILRALGFNSTAAKRRAQLMAELEHKIAAVSQPTALLACLSVCLLAGLSVGLPFRLIVCLSVCLAVCSPVSQSLCLFARLFVCLFV